MNEPNASPQGELLVGGQALIEGVMMRSPGAYGVAVRRADGSIALQRGKVFPLGKRWPVLKLPVLRGCAVLFQSLYLGIKALNFSAEQAAGGGNSTEQPRRTGGEPADPNAPPEAGLHRGLFAVAAADGSAGSPPPAAFLANAPPEAGGEPAPKKELSGLAIAGSMAVGLGLGIALFLFLPLWLTQMAEKYWLGPLSSLSFNLLDGGLRGIFFLLYIYLISRMKDIHRVFMYHGAEHKVVFAWEKQGPLTVDTARAQSRLHPRCGTSFLLFVLLVSIVLFALIPKTAPFLLKFGGRLVLVPVVAGLSYEVLRLTARKRAAPLFAALVAPGLALQRITTQEPTDDMLQVAIVALEEALREDGLLAEAA